VPDEIPRSAIRAALPGRTIAAIVALSQPWATATRTSFVSFDRGEPVVVQWATDRATIRRRIHVASRLAVTAPWLPFPTVLGGDAGAGTPFVISAYEAGTAGADLLGNDADAAHLGSLAGALVRDVGLVPLPMAGLRLSRTWSDPSRLETAARGWLARTTDVFGAAMVRAVHAALGDLPRLFDGATPTFAHGDFVPVNIVIRDGVVVALLDLERARIAHPLFDPAWFRLIVRHHHPVRWAAIEPSFAAAAGLARSATDGHRLDVLNVLQCLEEVARTPRSSGAAREAWTARLEDVIQHRR
jgi:aminoglycoside phosphotransferase (APT) family kinase protein